VFFHTWTVNWKFLPQALFVSRGLAAALLGGHIASLVALAALKWCACDDGGVVGTVAAVLGLAPGPARIGDGREAAGPAPTGQGESSDASAPGGARSHLRRRGAAGGNAKPDDALATQTVPRVARAGGHFTGAFRDGPAYIAYVLLSSNFVGIVFARTLHYQFYSWYFHALPLLLWAGDAEEAGSAEEERAGPGAASSRGRHGGTGTGREAQAPDDGWWPSLPLLARLAIMAGIEYAFNVGDAAGAGTPLSSAVLQAAHMLLLASLFLSRPVAPGRGLGLSAGALRKVAATAAPGGRMRGAGQ
jgi:hypothetical protein